MPTVTRPASRLGRPPRLDDAGTTTRERLLAAAVASCVEHGFEAATVADIAKRADVSAPAIYNHFGGKAELLVAAGRAALDRLAPPDGAGRSAAGVIRAYLANDFADTRRLLAELHLAGQRHADVAELLEAWHRDHATHWARLAGRPDAMASVKAFFTLLMGLCHLDALASIDVPPSALCDRLIATLPTLFPDLPPDPAHEEDLP